jgi:hypothetical protein
MFLETVRKVRYRNRHVPQTQCCTVFVNQILFARLQFIPDKAKVMLRPMISPPVCLGVRHPCGAHDQTLITFRQFRVCWCGASSLTRGRVCSSHLLLGLTSRVRVTHDLRPYFTSRISDSPNLEGQVPVFISSKNRVAQLYPRALGSLSVASYDSQGYGGGILTRLQTAFLFFLQII